MLIFSIVEELLNYYFVMFSNVDKTAVDMCYPPIIQSGGNYKLKFSVVRYNHATNQCCESGMIYSGSGSDLNYFEKFRKMPFAGTQ